MTGIRVLFAPVGVHVSSAVNDPFDIRTGKRHDGLAVGDVQAVAAQRDHPAAGKGGKRLGKGAAKHSIGAGD
jgi:hypothetical protein